MELVHRIKSNFGYSDTKIIKSEYEKTLKIYRAYQGEIGGYQQHTFAMDDEYGIPPYWEFTNELLYISTPFQVEMPSKVQDELEGLDIVEETEGYFTFTTGSPYEGEKCYFKGFSTKYLGVSPTTVLYPNKTYHIITKDISKLANFSINVLVDLSDMKIEEPIGFDQFKMIMQRTDYHGISAEVSQLDLEFYGKAATIIKEAYEKDLDSELNYIVTNDAVEVYNGMIDLSTYQETQGSYRSVSCKVGEIGVKTTFNNRNETEVDLNSDTTIDGEELVELPTWKSLQIPKKHLLYTNKSIREEDKTYTTSGGDSNSFPEEGMWVAYPDSPYIYIPVSDVNQANEFGGFTESEPYGALDLSFMPISYTPDQEHEKKYGKDTYMQVDIKMHVKMQKKYQLVCDLDWRIGVKSNGVVSYGPSVHIRKEDANGVGSVQWEMVLTYKGKLKADYNMQYFLECAMDLGELNRHYFNFHTTVYKDSYIKMEMYDNLQEETKNTNMLMVYDALKTISLITTENKLPIKSEWYDYSDLREGIVEQHGGAAKAITNGYKIRDIKTESGKEYPMSMSFRDLFESLNAMDCIGWGIVNEEGGLFLRVERWDWFYKDEEVLVLEEANELKTSLNKDLCVTEFEIGYDKYVTSDVYNSIENLHSERKFSSPVKALNNKVTVKSKIIADNYAIEETRRAQFQAKPSESFDYDENIFVFELRKGGTTINPIVIRTTAEETVGIKRPSEFINANLTPRQCAARWAGYLFAMNGAKALKYVTASANSDAGFKISSGALLLSMANNPQMENDDIERKPHKLKAETLEFTYPLTIEQYKKIKNNPYGLITVNGIQGWIKEFTYSFVDGEAEFKLIPKAK